MKTEQIESGIKATIENKDQIMDAFANSGTMNDMTEVLKELFNEDKIYMIGDLSKDEIKLATRIFMVAEIKNIEIWKTGLAFYCKLLLSKNRKSRKELLDAIRGYSAQKTFFQKMNPFS